MPAQNVSEAAAKMQRKLASVNVAEATAAWRRGIADGDSKLATKGFGPSFRGKWSAGVQSANFHLGDTSKAASRWQEAVSR